MRFPLDRSYYTKDGAHIWLKEEDGLLLIGMDAFNTEMVGLLTFLNVTAEKAAEGEALGSFESAKFVSRFYSPVSGEVVKINDEVINNPRMINEDPYSSWIVAIRPEALDNLLDSEFMLTEGPDIEEWIADELRRMEEE